MTIIIQLPPEVEAQAAAQARAQGMELAQYLPTLIEQSLPMQAQARAAHNAATSALLDSFMEGDPQEHRETLEYLQQAMDEDRPGQRRLWGTGFNPPARKPRRKQS